MTNSLPHEHTLYQAAIEKLIREHGLAVEDLTEKQLAEAIRQALASGDFIRNVRVDNQAQCVVYIPYVNEERSKAKLQSLRDALEKIQNYPVHSEPVGGAYAMQDIAHEALRSSYDEL